MIYWRPEHVEWLNYMFPYDPWEEDKDKLLIQQGVQRVVQAIAQKVEQARKANGKRSGEIPTPDQQERST